MEIIENRKDLLTILNTWKDLNLTTAFVPTMGYLHEGHLSLVKKGNEQADKSIVSIFVNPTQFGPNEDFSQYPRDLNRDITLLNEANCDLIFAPDVDEIYDGSQIPHWSVPDSLSLRLCGRSRPGHFDGVVEVVTRLFTLIPADFAIFGEKDYQQLCIIKTMTNALKLKPKILSGPIIRNPEGLALSSRNKYLNDLEKNTALCLFQSIQEAKKMAAIDPTMNAQSILEYLKGTLFNNPLIKLDYLEIIDERNLSLLENLNPFARLMIAVYIGQTRLIDNANLFE